MTKQKPPGGSPALTPDPNSAKAQEKIATLRSYYALGQRASDTKADGTAKQPESLRALAAETGVQTDTIRKAEKFASTYTLDELEWLLQLRSPNGQPPSWYLVRILLQVKDKAQRSELQRQAIEAGWSRLELQAAVQVRQGGKKSPGGRRFAVPESTQQVLKRLTDLSESWLRFYVDIGEEGGLSEKLRTAKRQGKNSAGLKRAVRETAEQLRALQMAASRLLGRLEEGESDPNRSR